MPQQPGRFSQTCLVLELVFQCFFFSTIKYKSYMQSVSNMFRDLSYIVLQMHIHTTRSSHFHGKMSYNMMLKVNWSLGSMHLIFCFLLAMCKRCRDHLQMLTENASPVSQGNPTLMDIFSQTPAGDALEEKSSESSEHKSTQVGSEKVLSFVSPF